MLNYFKPALLAPAALFLLSVSLSASAAGNNIVIGQAVDLSGPNASIGRDYVAGIKTYFDMVNSSGGLNGKRIQYLARDDRGQPELSARIASELIEREQADYLLGGVGDDVTHAVLGAPSFKRSGHVWWEQSSVGLRRHRAVPQTWRLDVLAGGYDLTLISTPTSSHQPISFSIQ